MRREIAEWIEKNRDKADGLIIQLHGKYKMRCGCPVKKLSICPELDKPVVAIVQTASGCILEQYLMNGRKYKGKKTQLDLIEV